MFMCFFLNNKNTYALLSWIAWHVLRDYWKKGVLKITFEKSQKHSLARDISSYPYNTSQLNIIKQRALQLYLLKNKSFQSTSKYQIRLPCCFRLPLFSIFKVWLMPMKHAEIYTWFPVEEKLTQEGKQMICFSVS